MVETNKNSRIELFFSAQNLQNKDLLSKSDPYCIISIQVPGTNTFQELSRTEVIRNSLNPVWKTTVILEYHFELSQVLQFSIYDYDGKTSEDLGSSVIPLSHLVSKRVSSIKLSPQSSLTIRIEEIKPSSEGFQVTFKGHKLDKKDFFGKSDPYLIIYKYIGEDSWAEAYRTEIIMKTLNPEWKPMTMSVQKLCNDDRLKPVKIECFDWDRIGKDDFIGAAEVNVTQLTSEGFQFELWGKNKKKGKNSGWIQASQVQFGRFPSSLLDYLQAGMEISLSVALDFSSSVESNSGIDLHRQVPNQFEAALREIGSRLEVFDSDKLIPIYGFAGDIGKGTVNNCFALNFNEKNPFVPGIQGVIETYVKAKEKIKPSWPLNFHNVIDKIAKESKAVGKSNQVYHIILILATGEIDDLDECYESVIKSCLLPISIIIAGVGVSSFNRIQQFEERCLKASRDNVKSRENIQFVRFNTFRGDSIALAGEVLKKIPSHILEYMDRANYRPLLQNNLNY